MLTRTVSGRTYTFSHAIGRQTNVGVGFRFPVDLALGDKESIYVLSLGDGDVGGVGGTRVTKCTMYEEYLLEFGSHGSSDGQFSMVTSLASDKDGNVYVADQWLNRISIFDQDGNFLDKWGTPGSSDGELTRPWGITFDQEDNLWVVDSGNNRIQKFTRDGRFLTKWGSGGSGEGEFNMPWGITVDCDGDVYVADWKNDRVQKFTSEGRPLMTFGAPGSGAGKLTKPSGVAVDGDGDVYVADWGANQVQVYGPDGTYLTTFAGDAQQLSEWARVFVDANPDYLKARRRVETIEPEWRLLYPTAVEIDGQGRIVITDCQRNRLQVYIKERDYAEPQFNL